MKNDAIKISTLPHTWILDIDGTIVKHNGYLTDGTDTLLTGAVDFLKNIPEKDMLVFVTSRKEKYREITEKFLSQNNIRYDHIIFNAPYGERILLNDDKPSGLSMSHALRKKRDSETFPVIYEDKNL